MGINFLFNSLKLCLFSAQLRINLLVAILPKLQRASIYPCLSFFPHSLYRYCQASLCTSPSFFPSIPVSFHALHLPSSDHYRPVWEETAKNTCFCFHIPLTSAQSDTNTPPHPHFLPALTTTEQPAMSLHIFSFRFAILSAASERCGVTWLRATPMQLPILYSMSSWGEVTEALQGLQK